MDYYYNNSNSGNNNTATTNNNDDNTIISYQQQQQLQSFSYNGTHHNNNNELQDDTTIQLLTSPTDEIYHRLQQPWNLHSNSILSTNIEGSNQPERGIAGFVSKLYQCLQAPDDGHKYARWCRHNGIDMFIIDCIPKFTETVLPRLFKHCKFASFVRQLNIYGFQRDTDARKSKDSKDKETCRWHHIHFRPGRRDLFHLIRRKTPRYSRSRRKRPKTEEEEGDLEDDPETILNTSSGDDDDLEDNNTISLDDGTQSSGFDDRHRSASLVSSPILYQQQQVHHTNNINLDYKSRQLQMIYESPQEVDNYLQINNQPQSSSTASSPQYCQSLPNTNTVKSVVPLPMTATYNGLEMEDPNDLYLMQQHHHQATTMGQPQNDQVEHLQTEIEQLRKGYLKMYKILSGEVNKAINLIGIQRSRIEYLENTLRSSSNNQHHQQQQLRLRQQVLPFIDTTLTNNSTDNYFTNHNNENNSSILYHHHHSTNTTPTTPIYPQTVTNPIHQQHIVHSSPSGSSGVLHEGYNFLFNHNNDSGNSNNPTNNSNNAIEEELKLSVTSSDEKWISTPQNISLIQHNNHL